MNARKQLFDKYLSEFDSIVADPTCDKEFLWDLAKSVDTLDELYAALQVTLGERALTDEQIDRMQEVGLDYTKLYQLTLKQPSAVSPTITLSALAYIGYYAIRNGKFPIVKENEVKYVAC